MDTLRGPDGITFATELKPGETWTYTEGTGLCIARPDKTKPLVQIDLPSWTDYGNPLSFTFVGEDEPRAIFISQE